MKKIVLFIFALLVTIACTFVFVGCGGESGGGSGIDGDEFMNVAVSESGNLTWTKLNRAKKYEILNGKFGTGAPSRETTDCSFDLTVFSLKEGKNYMTLLGIEDNNELGETIEMEFAVYEMIIEIKGGAYTLYARSYSDEYLSLSGFEEKDGIVTKYIQPTFYSDLGGATYTSMPKDIKINGDNIWGLYSDAEYKNECGSQIITGLKKGHNYYYIKLNDKNGTFLKGYRIDFYILDKIDVVLYSKTGEKLFETNVWENDALDMSILYANVGENDYIAYNFEPIERDVASVDIQKDASFRVISSDEYNLLKHFTVSYDGVLTKKADHNCDGIENLTIPAQICGRNVVTIGNGSDALCNIKNLVLNDGIKELAGFAFSSTIETVSLPDSLTSIETSAFDGCTGLTSIIIPDGVTSLGDFAFRGCKGLTSITIPDSVTSIGRGAFSNCTQLTSVTIGNSITSVGIDTFSGCTSLSCITLPNSVTSIGAGAFNNCIALTKITIPKSITSIGDSAFYGCYRLIEVYNMSALGIVAGSWQYGYVGQYAKHVYTQQGDSKLNTDANGYIVYTDGNDKILVKYTGEYTQLTLPGGITEIYQFAFYDCNRLTNINIPDSVTNIGDRAFSGCASLTSINIPDNVTSIGAYVFYHCRNLTSVTIGNSVTSIKESAFDCCEKLTSINIPDSVTSIGRSAFSYCQSLTSVVIPDSVTNIDVNAFYFCKALTIVTIGNSVTSIESSAFGGCSSLTSITIPDSVTYIGWNAFLGCALKNVVFENTQGWINNYSGETVSFSNPAKAAEILIKEGSGDFKRN